jgi:hypothetical protein
VRLLVRAQVAVQDVVRDRVERLRGRRGVSDRGSALEWVLIAAACALMIGVIYLAINGKVQEKIGDINNA